jgi:hypothetical protein
MKSMTNRDFVRKFESLELGEYEVTRYRKPWRRVWVLAVGAALPGPLSPPLPRDSSRDVTCCVDGLPCVPDFIGEPGVERPVTTTVTLKPAPAPSEAGTADKPMDKKMDELLARGRATIDATGPDTAQGMGKATVPVIQTGLAMDAAASAALAGLDDADGTGSVPDKPVPPRPPAEFKKWNSMRQKMWVFEHWSDLSQNPHLTADEVDEAVAERLMEMGT